MSDSVITLKAPGGGSVQLDEYNMTVTDNGRKCGVRDLTMPALDRLFDAAARRDLSVAGVHTASALASFITGYRNEGVVADIVCPPLMVSKASDYYYTFSKNDVFRRVNTTLASEDAEPVEVGPTLSSSTFTCKAYGVSSFIAQGVEANADPGINPMLAAMRRCLAVMAIEREHRVQALLNNATTFASYTSTLSSSNYWADGASSDPVADIMTAQETADMPITHMVVSRKSWNRFIKNAQVAKYSQFAATDALSLDPGSLMARLGFAGIQVLISDMKSESTTSGTTTLSYVWDDDAFFLHIPAGADADPTEIPTCRNFRWLKDGASRDTMGFRVREWDVPGRGQDGGKKIAVVCNEVETVVAANTGYLLINVW
jgi:hypothetical protein